MNFPSSRSQTSPDQAAAYGIPKETARSRDTGTGLTQNLKRHLILCNEGFQGVFALHRDISNSCAGPSSVCRGTRCGHCGTRGAEAGGRLRRTTYQKVCPTIWKSLVRCVLEVRVPVPIFA